MTLRPERASGLAHDHQTRTASYAAARSHWHRCHYEEDSIFGGSSRSNMDGAPRDFGVLADGMPSYSSGTGASHGRSKCNIGPAH